MQVDTKQFQFHDENSSLTWNTETLFYSNIYDF